MRNHVPSLIGAFVSDVLSLVSIPGSNVVGTVAGTAITDVMRRREDQARDVLRRALAAGAIDLTTVVSADHAAAILFRYVRAAQEGAARHNLRLLAQVIRGQLQVGRLSADEFLYYSDILASLRREEVVLLGHIIHVEQRLLDMHPSIGRGDIPANMLWDELDADLIGSELFPSKQALRGTIWGLVRTGMFWIGETVDENLGLKPAPLMWTIAALCDFEAASANSEDGDHAR